MRPGTWKGCGKDFPTEVHWTGASGDAPLPRRVILPLSRRHRQAEALALHHLDPLHRHYLGPRGQPFDFSQHMHRLCTDIVARCRVFQHIDPTRLLIAVGCNRSPEDHGIQAKIAGMRHRGGRLARVHHRRTYVVQRYYVGGVEILYLVIFYLPRFQDQSFDQKMITVFHELYHISPDFDGDLRRCSVSQRVHLGGKRGYDERMAKLAREYLASDPDPTLFSFLRLNFAQLHQWHGQVFGYAVPLPRVIPVRANAVPPSSSASRHQTS
jgi:predicted metallopeptidase